MEGAALREKKAFNVALVTAWHTARFALNGFGDKGRLAGTKTLADMLLGDDDDEPRRELNHAKAIAFFQRLKAEGFPVEITRH
jgi:hypothetical protein